MRMNMQNVGKKSIEQSRTMRTNPFGGQPATIKQEPAHYINAPGRNNYTNIQSLQRGRSGFRGRPYPRRTHNTRTQQQSNTNYNTQRQ